LLHLDLYSNLVYKKCPFGRFFFRYAPILIKHDKSMTDPGQKSRSKAGHKEDKSSTKVKQKWGNFKLKVDRNRSKVGHDELDLEMVRLIHIHPRLPLLQRGFLPRQKEVTLALPRRESLGLRKGGWNDNCSPLPVGEELEVRVTLPAPPSVQVRDC